MHACPARAGRHRPLAGHLLRPFHPDLLLVPPPRVPYAVSGCL